MESSRTLVAFDLDGTINQTHLYALQAYKKTFEIMNVGPFSEEEIISRFGAPFEDDVIFFFGDPSEDTIITYKQTLAKWWHYYLKKYAQVFPNVREVLNQLKNDGYTLCICSNAPVEEIKETLNCLGVSQYFCGIWGLEEEGQTKEDILKKVIEYYTPIRTFMVGDRYFDLQAAKANQVTFIGCLYGYGKKEVELADYPIRNIKEILNIIEAI